MSNMKNWCDGLRDLVSFVECREDMFDGYITPFTMNLFADDAENMAEKARLLGTASKHEQGGYYFLEKNFGPHSVQLNIQRDQICAKVQVGTKTVLRPDPGVPQIEVEEPVYEWTCPDSVLSGGLASDLSGDEPVTTDSEVEGVM